MSEKISQIIKKIKSISAWSHRDEVWKVCFLTNPISTGNYQKTLTNTRIEKNYFEFLWSFGIKSSYLWYFLRTFSFNFLSRAFCCNMHERKAEIERKVLKRWKKNMIKSKNRFNIRIETIYFFRLVSNFIYSK